jgi:hypothetical protein
MGRRTAPACKTIVHEGQSSVDGSPNLLEEIARDLIIPLLNEAVGNGVRIGRRTSYDFCNSDRLLETINEIANDGEFQGKQSVVSEAYKKHPSKFLDELLKGEGLGTFSPFVSDFIRTMRSGGIDVERTGIILDCLGQLACSQLIAVRFISLSVCYAILPVLMKHTKYFALARKLIEIALKRTHDTSDLVRKFAGLEIVCRAGNEVGFVSDDALCETIQGLLSDSSRTNRFRMINFLASELPNKKRESRVTMVSDKLKDYVIRCCFDTDHSVRIVALRLVSCPHAGDRLLCNDEEAYDRLSNLIWFMESGSNHHGELISHRGESDPFRLSREALAFVDNHIFASPGVLGAGSANNKLAGLVEFLLQYTDGHVYPLCDRFVGTLFSYFAFKKVDNNFLMESTVFENYISLALENLRRAHPGDRGQLEILRKVLAALELLLSVISFLRDDQVLNIMSFSLRSILANGFRQSVGDRQALCEEARPIRCYGLIMLNITHRVFIARDMMCPSIWPQIDPVSQSKFCICGAITDTSVVEDLSDRSW